MPVQPATDYQINHPEAVAGAIVDAQLQNSVTKLANGDLPFGRLVVEIVAGEASLPVTTGAIAASTAGIVQRVQDDVADANDVLMARDSKDATIADFAEVWVEVEDAVTFGSPCFARHSGGNLGQFRSDADTGSATAVQNARYMTSAGAGELAKVRIRLV